MRLLIVSQHFWPEEFRVNDLVVGLKERGHEVTVLTGQPNYPEGQIYESFRDDPAGFDEYAGAPIVRSPVVPRGKGGGLRLALNYLSFAVTGSTVGVWRLRKNEFDAVLIFQNSPITAAIPGLVLKRFKRVPVLLWVQDLWPETLAAIGVIRSPALLSLVGLMVRFIYRSCDRILIQSRVFEDKVRHYSGPNLRIDYFPNWFEPTFAAGLTDEAAPEVKRFATMFTVMFAGNIGEAQDLPSVLEAARMCYDIPNLRWLIVGDGRAREDMERAIKSMGLADRVILFGRHHSTRMPAFFKGADAMLVSLKAEPIWSLTIPSKVQSYMAAGRPILGMIDGEGARVLIESGGGLASPAGDPGALAANVRRLMGLSPQDRGAMGEAGRAYAISHFDRNALFTELETWFEEVQGRTLTHKETDRTLAE